MNGNGQCDITCLLIWATEESNWYRFKTTQGWVNYNTISIPQLSQPYIRHKLDQERSEWIWEEQRHQADSPRRDDPGSAVVPLWLTQPDGSHAPVS